MDTFVVTAAWIRKHKTAAGGWTRAQFAIVDIAWPPRHGWIARVVGKRLAERQRRSFEELNDG